MERHKVQEDAPLPANQALQSRMGQLLSAGRRGAEGHRRLSAESPPGVRGINGRGGTGFPATHRDLRCALFLQRSADIPS